MPSTLPRAFELVKLSWRDFIKNWDVTVRVSAWLILATVITALPTFLPGPKAVTATLDVVCAIVGTAIALWASVRLYQTVIGILDGKKPQAEPWKNAIPLILPSILISILTILSVLGGLILLIIPGIFIAIRLSFVQVALIQDGQRGTNALKASWAITKGRFWATLWRLFVSGLIIIIIVIPVAWIALWIVGLVSGTDIIGALGETSTPTAIIQVNDIVNSIVQAAIVPFAIFYVVRLYRELKKTAE
jgi:hypothetical protein